MFYWKGAATSSTSLISMSLYRWLNNLYQPEPSDPHVPLGHLHCSARWQGTFEQFSDKMPGRTCSKIAPDFGTVAVFLKCVYLIHTFVFVRCTLKHNLWKRVKSVLLLSQSGHSSAITPGPLKANPICFIVGALNRRLVSLGCNPTQSWVSENRVRVSRT